MKNKALFVGLLLIVVFTFGCLKGFNAEDLIKSNAQTKAFLEQYPNAEIKSIHLSPEQAQNMLSEIKQDCGNQMEAKEYFKVTINDASSGLSMLAYIDAQNQIVECAVRKGKTGETIPQPSGSCTISPGLSCDEFMITKDKVTLIIRNGLGEDANIDRITLAGDGITECVAQSGKIVNGATATFNIPCKITTDNVKADIILEYNGKKALGSVISKVGEGTPTPATESKPNSCTISPGIACQEFKIVSGSGKSTVILLSGLGADVDGITVSIDGKNSNECNNLQIPWSDGDMLTCTWNGLTTLPEGSQYKAYISVAYTEGGLKKTKTGSINSKVEGTGTISDQQKEIWRSQCALYCSLGQMDNFNNKEFKLTDSRVYKCSELTTCESKTTPTTTKLSDDVFGTADTTISKLNSATKLTVPTVINVKQGEVSTATIYVGNDGNPSNGCSDPDTFSITLGGVEGKTCNSAQSVCAKIISKNTATLSAGQKVAFVVAVAATADAPLSNTGSLEVTDRTVSLEVKCGSKSYSTSTFTINVQESEDTANAKIKCATDVSFKISNVCLLSTGGYKVTIENNGQAKLDNLIVRFYAAADKMTTSQTMFTPGGVDGYAITSGTYNGVTSGIKYVEAIPMISVSGKQITCSANRQDFGAIDGAAITTVCS